MAGLSERPLSWPQRSGPANQAYADMRAGINIRGVIDFVPVGPDLG